MNYDVFDDLRKAHFDDSTKNKLTAETPRITPEQYTQADVQLKAMGVLSQWIETASEDLGADETMAQHLTALLCVFADEDNDGEISDDEQALIDIAVNAIADAMIEFGVDEDDVRALLEDEDEEAAQRVLDLLKDTASDGFIDDFVFGDGTNEPLFDAVMKKVAVVRAGKKIIVKKRISGMVRRSAKQKAAIKKAVLKSHSGMAQMKRARSLRKRAALGL